MYNAKDKYFNVVVKVSYKVTSMDGRVNQRKETKISPEILSYDKALDRVCLDVSQLAMEITNELGMFDKTIPLPKKNVIPGEEK